MNGKGSISIKGARANNLKGFNLEIPRGRLVVITGISGSGKSSLSGKTADSCSYLPAGEYLYNFDRPSIAPGLFSGALITETLFSIPGIGYASYHAMVGGDIPFSMFYLVFLAILTLIGNLISDILYAVVDPRVRIA